MTRGFAKTNLQNQLSPQTITQYSFHQTLLNNYSTESSLVVGFCAISSLGSVVPALESALHPSE